MIIHQCSWTEAQGFDPPLTAWPEFSPDLILIFGHRPLLCGPFPLNQITRAFPGAIAFGCSTAGEISDTAVSSHSVQITFAAFCRSTLQAGHVRIDKRTNSRKTGQELAASIPHEGLVHAFVLSDGLEINGSNLVEGLKEGFPASVSISGGLSADMDQFRETVVLTGHGFERQMAGVVGFYGSSLRVGYGSAGGWDPFGPKRLITRSVDNVLYEMDGKSVLDLYKTYLGEHASGLPATGLLFPLSLTIDPQAEALTRTVLSVNEADQSMTFAGNLPQGAYASLMKANTDRLIDGASQAAHINLQCLPGTKPQLAILISCVGRRMVMGQRVEEEVEAVKEILGEQCRLSGFYSYGEISPHKPGTSCELHNQTMTITTLSEKECP